MSEAAVMHVILTFAAAEKQWGEKVHLTLAHQPNLGTTWQIHLDRANSPSQNLFLIQTAARKLDNQGIKAVALIGDGWNAESCFAFWQGYRNPKAAPQITYPQLDNVQQKQLDNWLLTAEWVRETINMPAEDLGPQQLADRAINLLQQVAPANSLTIETLVGDELLAKQYMGLHTVGRGSTRAPVYLRIDFNPTSDAQAKTFACLVGKGITFDTGGYSLKPSNFMDSMKSDMGGSALAAGSFALAILQGLNKRVQLILCCADNMISGNAFRLGDIIHYRNGKRVEVMNTDAEGRLVLADGLIDASHINPDYIIDCATLTGAAKIALGNDYHSIMTFDDQFADKLLAVAKQEHEGFWRLPLEEFHRKQMPSSFADITNTSSPAHTAGACIAAAFLSHFVERYQTNWLHIDCSATYRKSPVEQWATGATGVGVRTLASLLLS